VYIGLSHAYPISCFSKLVSWFVDLDQECFCPCRYDAAPEQAPVPPLRTLLDSTEAAAHEEIFCVSIEAFAWCGQELEDFEDITETRRSTVRAPNQAAP